MGMDLSTYCGPYIIVKSSITETNIRYRCSKKECNQHKRSDYRKEGNFCPICGSSIEEFPETRQVPFRIHEYCEEKFGDEDLFCDGRGEGGGKHTIIVSNSRGQGGKHLGEDSDNINFLKDGEFTMTKDFERPDWKKLIDSLNADNIKFELAWGVVQWWS